jgi:hypothetical protein
LRTMPFSLRSNCSLTVTSPLISRQSTGRMRIMLDLTSIGEILSWSSLFLTDGDSILLYDKKPGGLGASEEIYYNILSFRCFPTLTSSSPPHTPSASHSLCLTLSPPHTPVDREMLLLSAQEILLECNCLNGCPSCVLSQKLNSSPTSPSNPVSVSVSLLASLSLCLSPPSDALSGSGAMIRSAASFSCTSSSLVSDASVERSSPPLLPHKHPFQRHSMRSPRERRRQVSRRRQGELSSYLFSSLSARGRSQVIREDNSDDDAS